jgi:hypothetical protein
MQTIDLHTHTTYSDGSYTPTELIEYAIQKHLSAAAITDHDTTDGVAEAIKAAEGSGLEVIPGIEISSMYDRLEIHIVGLFIDYQSKPLAERLAALRSSRVDRNRLMVQRLNALGLDLSYEEVAAFANGTVITRAHFAGLMLKKGYISSVNEAFERYIGDRCSAYVPRELPDYTTAVELIHSAGGIAVLAHPLLYKINTKGLENMIATLAKSGISGIEAYYSTHSPADTKYIKRLAAENRLLLSGGSDFHGSNKPRLDLGTGYGSLAVPYELLDKLKGELKNG